MAKHADGAGNDSLLRVRTLTGVGVRVAGDFDPVHRRAHGASLQGFVRQVVMLGRMVIPHCPMWRHELDPSGIIDLWSGRIFRTISPKQNTQMIPVYGIHPRGEDQAKTAVIGLRERETRTATHPAHCAIDYAPRRWVCFPTLEVLTVENLHATRIRYGLATGIRRHTGSGRSPVSGRTDKGEGATHQNRKDEGSEYGHRKSSEALDRYFHLSYLI